MTTHALTCRGCGGRNLYSVEPTEEEMTIRVNPDGSRVVRLPLPMLCLDCGSASNSLKKVADV